MLTVRDVHEEEPQIPKDEELEEDEDCELGRMVPVTLADPKLPNVEEVSENEFTHLPHRSWCSQCVRGKGKTLDHRKSDRKQILPEVHLDYCFMGASGDEKTRAIIVAKHRDSRFVLGVVPTKESSTDEFVLSCENSGWNMQI